MTRIIVAGLAALILITHPGVVPVILGAVLITFGLALAAVIVYAAGLVRGAWKPPARVVRYAGQGWSVEFL